MEVPPNIEGEANGSTLQRFLVIWPNDLFLKDKFKPATFFDSWQDSCKYYFEVKASRIFAIEPICIST